MHGAKKWRPSLGGGLQGISENDELLEVEPQETKKPGVNNDKPGLPAKKDAAMSFEASLAALEPQGQPQKGPLDPKAATKVELQKSLAELQKAEARMKELESQQRNANSKEYAEDYKEDHKPFERAAQEKAIKDRLKTVREVNKALHGAYVRKRIIIEKLEKENDKLDERLLIARDVTEPVRQECVAEVEEWIRDHQQAQQIVNLELGNHIMEWEEKAHALQVRNSELRDTGTSNRSLLREQDVEIETMQRTVRDLKRHIEIMEGYRDIGDLGDLDVMANLAAAEAAEAAVDAGRSLVDDSDQGSSSPSSRLLVEDSQDYTPGHRRSDENKANVRAASKPDQQITSRMPKLMSHSGQSHRHVDYSTLPGLDLQNLLNPLR